MAMVVQHNLAAQLALGELRKNNDKLGKSLEKISSGQKINSAKDDSASFSISELMRVKIRALDQANQNVQNGSSLLKSAEAGIQHQIEIVRTIREKVIDANNDTNTDEDRKIMQKELNQLYDQIDQTAYFTDYNTKKILLGDAYWKTISRWVTSDTPQINPTSILDVVPDVYSSLDGLEGSFDIFTAYGSSVTTIAPLLGNDSSKNLYGGADGSSAVITYDLSQVYNGTSVPAGFNGLGFSVTGYSADEYSYTTNYLLTTNTSTLYNSGGRNVTKIDISGCSSIADIANAIAAKVNGSTWSGGMSGYTTATANNGVLTFTSANKSTVSNKSSIGGWSASPTSITPGTSRQGATPTGLGLPRNLSGGKDAVTVTEVESPAYSVYDPKTDKTIRYPAKTKTFEKVPGEKASLSLNVSSVPEGSGITISGTTTEYIKFVSGSSITRDSDGVWLVGKDSSGSKSIAGMTLSMSGGTITLTADRAGTVGNNYRISADGFSPETPGTPINYQGVTAMRATKDTHWTMQAATDGPKAHYDIDLSAYDTNNPDKLDEFISALRGKGMNAAGSIFGFVDTTYPSSFSSKSTLSGPIIDLKLLRSEVENGGKTIAKAFIDNLVGRSATKFENLDLDNDQQPDNTTLRVWANRRGSAGNNETVSLMKGELAHYDIDFKSWFENNASSLQPSVADYLDGKGFRVYCATHHNQWYNIEFFTPASLEDETKPVSNNTAYDFTPIPIDVSKVTDYHSLVQAIYDQGMPQFQEINHTLSLAADPNDGILTVYDVRSFNPLVYPYRSEYPYAQEKGAKISDGIVSDVMKIKKDLMIRNLVIHDTDKASMNFRAKIPDMRLDSIFGIMPNYEKENIKEYSLVSKEDRAALLGKPPAELGILDTGLNYLLDAAVMVGTQNSRLEHDHQNLLVQIENTTASESTIRDADMAKEMTEYTKNNVLTQSAQAMLAQANQNSSGVLSLLQ